MTNEIKHQLAVDAIKKKLKGTSLNYNEVFSIMDEISHDRLGDVLTTYFAASGFTSGFSSLELYYLTKAMVDTGQVMKFKGIVADKHSIGGIAGTRTSMIVVPIIIAAGFTMPKTSSRAITSPAGTADVMEVLAKVDFTPEHVKKIVDRVGGCIIWGGHLGIAPADDIIIQVEEELSFESYDKFIVSIMAKKIAMSATHLVLDIPIGPTMKIKSEKDAQLVRQKFEELAHKFEIAVEVDINHTFEPAGNGIGPALEAIDVLKVLEQDPALPAELEKRSLRIASKLLDLCYKTSNINKDGMTEATKILESGAALEKFKDIIEAQQGNRKVTSKKIKYGKFSKKDLSPTSGTIKRINNYNLNAVTKILGAPNDKYAGIVLNKRRGNKIKKDELKMTLFSTHEKNIHEAVETLTTFPVYEIS